jgi:hypothetical protein
VIEARVDAAIRQKFGLPTEQHPTVKYADLVMLASERRDFEIDDGSVAMPRRLSQRIYSLSIQSVLASHTACS